MPGIDAPKRVQNPLLGQLKRPTPLWHKLAQVRFNSRFPLQRGNRELSKSPDGFTGNAARPGAEMRNAE